MIGKNGAPEIFEDGLVYHHRFSSDVCLIWFAGVTLTNLGVVMANPMKYWRSLGISLITIADIKRLACVAGYGRYFPDRSAAERSVIELVKHLGYRRFATAGMSLSGYSALLYGMNIGAVGGLSFAGPNYIPTPETIVDRRGEKPLRRLLRSVSLEHRHIRPFAGGQSRFSRALPLWDSMRVRCRSGKAPGRDSLGPSISGAAR
jgi:pimeloyl-ACP methyl ester carboxylesterase